MSHLTAPAPSRPVTSRASTARTVGRWLVSFVGFPLGGLVAIPLVGPVDSVVPALAGGVITGAILGAVQGWAMRAERSFLVGWTIATAVGLALGLALGASLVGFESDLGSLVVQGAVTGAAVGLAQAVLLFPHLGRLALAWPGYLAAVWAVGWVVSTSIGVRVDEQFTVFGASGAITAALLTAVLPVLLSSRRTPGIDR